MQSLAQTRSSLLCPWTDNTALRRALAVGFSTPHILSHSVVVFTDDGGFEPQLDEVQNATVNYALGHHRHQSGVRDAVKVFRQIGVYDLGVACP